jgi:hypothetical protein
MYEKRPQVLATTLADAHHHPALAARMLTRNKSEPGRQVPAVLETRTIPDCRYHRGCGLGANPPDLGDSLADLAGFEDRIAPGKRMQNAFIGSFNSRLRDEYINENVFLNLHEARATIAAWRDDYNHSRAYSSLGALTPNKFAQLQSRSFIPPPAGENDNSTLLIN